MEACTAVLQEIQSTETERFSDNAFHAQSLLMGIGAEPDPARILELMKQHGGIEKWRECAVDAIFWAHNPLIPAITSLVSLNEAARRSTQVSKKRDLEDAVEDIGNLIHQILNQLPKEIDAWEGKMSTCASIFEPEIFGSSATGFTGPLGLVLRHRHAMEILCPEPLVIDYLFRIFDQGRARRNKVRLTSMPGDVGDSGGSIGAPYLHQTFCWWADRLRGLLGRSATIQGGYMGSEEFRVLKASYKYYRVPKWRMVFDMEVYLVILVLFMKFVLLHDDGPPGVVESCFIIYIVVRGLNLITLRPERMYCIKSSLYRSFKCRAYA